MTRYVVNRLLLLIVVAVGVTTLLFVLSLLSGDPASLFAPPSASPEVIEQTRERLGLDRSWFIQYLDALVSAFTLDFGQSFAFRQPAFGMVVDALGPSLLIILPALTVAVLVALAVGTWAALRPTRASGRLIMLVAFITEGVPYFWAALMLVLLLAINWQLVPATGSDGITALVIPVIVLGVLGFSTLARLVRGQLLDAFAQPPVLTARSKGVSPRSVLIRHAFPLAIPPLVAWMGILFSFMFGALLVLEPILDYDGVGALLVRGVSGRDFPLVQASVFAIAILITLVNILIDVVVRIIDPRLRTEAAT